MNILKNKVVLYVIVGFVLTIVSGVYLYIFKDLLHVSMTNILILSILSIGIALMSIPLTGEINYNNSVIKARGPGAIFAIVFIIGIGYIKLQSNSFSYTVYIVDNNNKSITEGGALRIKLGETPREETIDRYGSVYFRGISSEFSGKKVSIELVNLPKWQFLNGKQSSEITLSERSNTIVLGINSNLCCLKGTVVDHEGHALSNVEVWTDTARTITTTTGRFEILLPTNLQPLDEFKVFLKKGKKEKNLIIDRVHESTILLP